MTAQRSGSAPPPGTLLWAVSRCQNRLVTVVGAPVHSFVTPPRLPPGAGGGDLRALDVGMHWNLGGSLFWAILALSSPGGASPCGSSPKDPPEKPSAAWSSAPRLRPNPNPSQSPWSNLALTGLSAYQSKRLPQSLLAGRPGTADTCRWGIPGGLVSWCRELSCPDLGSLQGCACVLPCLGIPIFIQPSASDFYSCIIILLPRR